MLFKTSVMFAAVVGASNPLDPCSTVECKSNQACYFGICMDKLPNPLDPEPNACDPACLGSQQCVFGTCIGSPERPNANSTDCEPKCSATEDCRWNHCVPSLSSPCTPGCLPFWQDCRNGQCVDTKPFEVPCSPDCSDGSKCSFGVCVPTKSTKCPGTCPTGTECSYGVCIPSLPPCWPPCMFNSKCVSDGDKHTCVKQNATCDGKCDNTTAVCLFGVCVECPLCQKLESRIVDGLANTDFDLSKLKDIETIINETDWKEVALKAEEILATSLEAAATVKNIVSDLVTCNNAATLALLPNTNMNVGTLESGVASLEKCAILLSRASAFTSQNLTVTADRIMQILFDAKNVDLAFASKVIDRLVLAGKLMLSGDGRAQLPSAHDLVEAAKGALIQVSGDVRLHGFAGAATILVEAQQGLGAQMQVAKDDVFNVQGNVLGSEGTVFVEGQLSTSGLTFEPQISLGPNGIFNVIGDSFFGGNLAMNGGKLRIDSNGAVTFFEQILSCVSGAVIEFRVNDTLTDFLATATPETPVVGKICKYDAITSMFVKLFECSVKLVDDFGNSKTLTNKIADKATFGRRRLLSSAGTSESIWGATELTFSVTNDVLDTVGLPTYAYVLIAVGSVAALAFIVCFFRRKNSASENLPLFDGSNTHKYDQVRD